MENTQMSKKMRQKKQKMDIGKLWGFQKWKAMVVAALLCFVGSQAMAANRTITLSLQNANSGTMRYKIENGEWSEYRASWSFTVADGKTVTIQANREYGWTFRRWTQGGSQVSTESTYTFTVSANRTLTAVFENTTWEGNLEAGDYTVTSFSSYTFQVTKGTTTKSYSEIGQLKVLSGRVNIHFKNTYTLRTVGTISVENTAQLYIYVEGADRTIERVTDYLPMIQCLNNSSLNINPDKTYRFTIDGGAVFATANDGRTAYDHTSRQGELIVIRGGCNIYNTLLQNAYANNNGGALSFYEGTSSTPRTITVQDVEIRGIQAPYVVLLASGDHKITMNNVKIHQCMQINEQYDPGLIKTDGAGIIRTYGTAKQVLTLQDCEICNNRALDYGGAIAWNANGNPGTTKLIITDRTKIHHNISEKYGGALVIMGTAELSDCEIYNNEAATNGGAITVMGNGGGHIIFPGTGPSLFVGDQTKIYNNIANNMGGGIYFEVAPHNDVGWDPAGNPMSPEFRMEIGSGGFVYGNQARRGAGVAIVDQAANKHMNTEEFLPDHESGGHNVPNPAYQTMSGVYWRNVVISGGAVYGNQTIGGTNDYGGGYYIWKQTNPSIQNGSMGYTYGDNDLLDATTGDSKAGIINVSIEGGLVYNNSATNGDGGGLYITDDFTNSPSGDFGSECNCTVEGTARIYGNSADKNGGGICIEGGNFTMNGGAFGCEKFDFTDVTGTTHYDVSGKNISNSGNGGGFYVSGGNVLVTGGTIAYNETQASKSDNDTGNGGGFYVTGGNVEIKGGTITENTAQGNGGGFYVSTSSTSDLVKINSSEAATTIHANHAQNGGGAYIAQGKLEIKDSDTQITNNEATANGGGIYASSDIEFTDGTIADNEATNGGGLFIPRCDANLNFTSGTFNSNYASSKGGGIYISEGATIHLKGTAKLTANHVPATGKGGGIYMDGKLYLGGGSTSPFIKAYDNYAGTTATLNNIYLPSISKLVTLASDISHITGGVYDTHMGITVNEGNRPVVEVESAANEPWLYNLMSGITTTSGAVFDDSQHYIAIHTRRNIGAFNKQYIYFWTSWSTEVTANPGNSHIQLVNGTYHIKSPQGLAWFSSMVNGLNGQSATANRSLNAVLDADVDMSAHLWVPIGAITAYNNESSSYTESNSVAYTGSFNGQGHVISGINNGFLTGISKYGLFGAVSDNGTVKNTFVNGYADFATDENVSYSMGGISGVLSGNAIVSGSEAKGEMDATSCQTQTYVGGIVGHMQGASVVHSSMAMPNLTAGNNLTYGGGIAGYVGSTAAKVVNCFSNGQYTASTANQVIGGIAGMNYGKMENCYTRLRGSETDYFGWFASLNMGQIRYCYALDGTNHYVREGNGTFANHGNYGTTALVNGKYGFAHCDQQIAMASGESNTYLVNGAIGNDGELKGLQATLNAWVKSDLNGWDDDEDANENGYALWTRTMGSGINGDYPVPQLSDKNNTEAFCCVGSKDGVFMEYSSDLNDMIGDYNDNNANTVSINFEDEQIPFSWTNGSTYPWITWSTNPHDGVFCMASNNYHVANTTTTVTAIVDFTTEGTVSFYSRVSSESVNWDYGYFSIDGVQKYKEGGQTPNTWTLRSFEVTAGRHALSWSYHKDNSIDRGEDRYYIDDVTFTGMANVFDIYLYATPYEINESTNDGVRVYIEPNIGIEQADGNVLNARVGVTLDNSDGGDLGGLPYDWHMFSSALQAAPMGLVYHSDEGTYYVRENYTTLAAQGITHGDYTDPTKMDPPMTTWNTTPGQIGYFPTDAPYGPWRNTGSLSQGFDFYCFHEPSRHWINFKREGKEGFFDHWNQYVYNPATDKHTQIQYPNESTMVSGKGYMVALSQPSMMMADGVLNNTATQSSNASYNEGSGYDQPLRGLNLVGNPYQSYLDFNQFANTNGIDTYYILDADAKGYIAYTTGSTPQDSEWPNGLKGYTASRYIHPHQGFFVRVDAAQPISFNSDMRKGGTNTSSVGSDYRDWEPRYALVNMVCTDGGGRNDFATIELDRPEQGGGRKAKGLRSGDASIWFRLGDEDYQIAFAPVGTQSAPLRFEAYSDGVYTLRWNMQNGDFGYLHLIDNLTGADIDCLVADEYRFEASTHDYTSRFRLVFDFTGVEENDEPAEGSGNFIFQMGDELIVNGEGLLQMFDLNGRCLLSETLHGQQNTVGVPSVSNGVYIMRLTANNQTRTQKMVINK